MFTLPPLLPVKMQRRGSTYEIQHTSRFRFFRPTGGPVLAGGGACGVFTGGALTRRRQQQQQQCLPRGALGEIATAGRTTALRMAASDTQVPTAAAAAAAVHLTFLVFVCRPASTCFYAAFDT